MKHLALLVAVAACSHAAPPVSAPAPAAAPPPAPTAFAVKVSGAGRPVIFIPGLACAGDVWDGTLAHLGGKVQAHVITLAGFAGQPPMASPSLRAVHDQLVAYIAANHLDHPIVVGHSLGGVMALWLAATDPDVGGVIDVDGFPFLAGLGNPQTTADQAAAAAKGAHDQMAAMTQEQMGATLKQFMRAMITKDADYDRVTAEVAKSDVATVAEAFGELIAMDLRPDVAKIQVPVLIVGAGDDNAPLDQIQAAWHAQTDAIPHRELVVVEGARHFVMLDAPDKFYALVDAYLAK